MNAIDRLFAASESPALPINSHVIVEWDSVGFPLDRALLESALKMCRLEFPDLASKINKDVRVVIEWDEQTFLKNTLQIFDENFDSEREARELAKPFDLFQGSSFRVLCYRTHEKWRMVMTVHHSLADGAGQSLLYERFWKYYTGLEKQTSASPSHTFNEVFSALGYSRLWILKMIFRHFRPWKKTGVSVAALFDVGKTVDLSRRLQPICIKTLKVIFSEEKWAVVKTVADSKSSPDCRISRNDYLLACAMRAFSQVCENPDRITRIMLPTDLRGSLQMKPCLQNWVSSLPCVFTSQEMKSDSLLTQVHERVREGRKLENAIDLVITAGVLTRLLGNSLHRELVKYDWDPQTFYFSFLWSQVRLPEVDWAVLGLPKVRAWIQGSQLRQPGVGVVLNVEKKSASAVFEYLDVPGSRERVEAWVAAFEREVSAD